MTRMVRTIYIIFFLIPAFITEFHDFDFQKPWPNKELPTGCYVYQLDIICFSVSDHRISDHAEAAKHCEIHNGQLAFTLTEDIWRQIINVTKLNTTKINLSRYMWLRPKVPAHSKGLIDAHGKAINISSADLIWTNVDPEKHNTEHCSHASMSVGNIYLDGTGCNGKNFFCLCEYKIPLECNADTLRHQLPNASFIDRNSNSCFKIEDGVANNTTLIVRCNEGFVLDGPSLITCESLQWTQLPRCMKGCPLPEPRKHSKLWSSATYFQYEDDALFTCNDGYLNAKEDGTKHFIITCTESGRWSESEIDCVAIEPFDITTVELVHEEPLLLQCPIWHSQMDMKDIYWFKNDEDLLMGKEKYELTENGSLIISNATMSDVGFYNCFQYNKRNASSPLITNHLYHVVNQLHCDPINVSVIERVYSEGESAMLSCHSTTPEQYTFRWYKDNEILRNNDFHLTRPSGSLYIQRLGGMDAGTYRCEAVNRITCCELIVTYKVDVTLIGSQNPCLAPHHQTVNHLYNKVSLLLSTQPWLAKIWHKDEIMPSCYATIVDVKWIITAASCLDRFRRYSPKVVIVEIGSVRFPIELLKFHPHYKRGHPEDDLALVKLSQIDFKNGVFPACIVDSITSLDSCNTVSSVSGTVGGWGSLDIDHVAELTFRTENLIVAENEKCSGKWATKFGRGMFCAKDAVGKLPNYAGDYGSPFVVEYKGRVYLVGIHIWGLREKKKGEFDYFTNVTYHYSWVQSVILSE